MHLAAIIVSALASLAFVISPLRSAEVPMDPVLITVGSQTAYAYPGGTYRVIGVPTTFAWERLPGLQQRWTSGPAYPYRVLAQTILGDFGSSGIFRLPTTTMLPEGQNPSATHAPALVWGATTAIPQRVAIALPVPQLGYGQSATALVVLLMRDGTPVPESARDMTMYHSSNARLASVGPNGRVEATSRLLAGTVIISAANQGVVGTVQLRILPSETQLNLDDDGDGATNRWELLWRFDPADPTDGGTDVDGDGLTQREESALDTNPRRADTDFDGLSDRIDPEPLSPEVQPPMLTLTAPVSRAEITANTVVTIRGQVTDNGLVRRLTFFRSQAAVGALTLPSQGEFSFAMPVGVAPGPVELAVEASDVAGNVTRANVQINVTIGANRAPLVDAGMDRSVRPGRHYATLTVAVTDDGLPDMPGAVSMSWVQIAGPASARIVEPEAQQTLIEVVQVGTYAFRVIASDGDLSASDTVQLTFSDPAPRPLPDDRLHLVSRAAPGAERWADQICRGFKCSRDGRFVVFASLAYGLVPDDANASADVFVWDSVADQIERVSLAAGGREVSANVASTLQITPNGRFVVFQSPAADLVPGDLNQQPDCFLVDRLTGDIELVSRGLGGAQIFATGAVTQMLPAVSDDGRYITFVTSARVIPQDTNGTLDVYLWDRSLNAVELVSVQAPEGISAAGNSTDPVISGDGRYVAFSSTATTLSLLDTNADTDIYRRDRFLGITELVSVNQAGVKANGSSTLPAMAAGGMRIFFYSSATNLVSGDVSPGIDCYVRDFEQDSLSWVSQSAGSGIGAGTRFPPHVDETGSVVLINGVTPPPGITSTSGLFRIEWETGLIQGISAEMDNPGLRGYALSGDGRRVIAGAVGSLGWSVLSLAVPGIDEGIVMSMDAAVTHPGNARSVQASMSDDGRFVAFLSQASDLVAVHPDDQQMTGIWNAYVMDRNTGSMRQLSSPRSVANRENTLEVDVSADGRWVALASQAGDLLAEPMSAGVGRIFLLDLHSDQRWCISRNRAGQPVGGCINPSISADGRYVVYNSNASDLVDEDTNAAYDAFRWDRGTGQTIRVSLGVTGEQGAASSAAASRGRGISGDGQRIVFLSYASNLYANDTNGGPDLFLRDVEAGITEIVNVNSSGEVGNGTMSVGEAASFCISADGQSVAFASLSDNVVAEDTNGTWDVFLRTLSSQITSRVSVTDSGAQAVGGNTSEPSISADGRYITFSSFSPTLVENDSNGTWDVFVHDALFGATRLVSISNAGLPGNGISASSGVSGNGRFIFWQSLARTLAPYPPFSGSSTYQILGAPMPKFISAGPDQTAVAGTTVILSGYVPGGYAAAWSVVSGPGSVAFANATAASTTCIIDEPGSYWLRLTGTKGGLIGSDDAILAVTILPTPASNN